MGDRLIIYGNESGVLGRYVASKDIQSAAIVQVPGGQRLDWDLGSYTSKNPPISYQKKQGEPLELLTYRWRFFVPGWSSSWVISSTRIVGKLTIIGRVPFGSQCGILASGFKAIDACGFNHGYWIMGNCGVVSATQAIFGQGWSCSGNEQFEVEEISRQPAGIFGTGWTLTVSDRLETQSFSYPQEPNNFSLTNIPDGCAIAVTFAGGTSRQIPVNPCPTWVQKKPENACPDGTIHQCQHGATVCCYSCQNGRLTLVDKFNAINN